MLFVAALIVHPTNVFLAPLVVVCGWHAIALVSRTAFFRRLVLVLGLLVGIVVGMLFWPQNNAVLVRLISPAEFSQFVVDLGRLFSGATVYRFISGGVTGDRLDLYDVATWSVVAIAVCGFVERVRSERNSLDRALGIGLLLSLVGFYLVAGPRGVTPHFERYAMWTIMPCVLIISRGIGWWLRPAFNYRVWTQAAVGIVAVLLLVSFYAAYFRVFHATGGDSHLAFRTADVDPKQKALDAIRSATPTGEIARIVSEGWWTRLPLEYLLQGSENVRLVSRSDGEQALRGGGESRRDSSLVWFVELVGSNEERAAQEWFQNHKIPFVRREETDCAGRAVVAYFRRADNSANP